MNKVIKGLIGIGIFCALLAAILTGCAKKDTSQHGGIETKKDIPTYSRKISNYTLEEDYNPYRMDFFPEGVFYYVQDTEIAEGVDADEYEASTSMYFRHYDGDKNALICEVKNDYIRDLTAINRSDGIHFVTLFAGEKARIDDYSAEGKKNNSIELSDEFNSIEKLPMITALKSGDYAIGMDDELSFFDPEGNVSNEISAGGRISDIIENDDGIFAVFEEAAAAGSKTMMAKVDPSKSVFGIAREVPGNIGKVFAFDEKRFASYSNQYIYVFDMDEASDEVIVDLNAQSIVSSQIRYILLNDENICITLFDESNPKEGISVLNVPSPLENILYADVSSFYDEESGLVSFDSDEFKAFMNAYKTVYDKHNRLLVNESTKGKSSVVKEVARGIHWYQGLGHRHILTVENGKLTGVPTSSGEGLVIMEAPYPMGIMTTSECPQGAFDFIMYYCGLGLYLDKLNPEESSYGKNADTIAFFSTSVAKLNEGIFETELVFD